MKRPIALGALLLAGLVAVPSAARAQFPLSVELHGGLAMPTGDFGDLADTGMSLGVDGVVRVLPQLAVYGGYSLGTFGCSDAIIGTVCDPNDEFESAGFNLGVRASLPLQSTLHPWAGAGAIFHDIERGAAEAGGDTGFEVAAGLEVELSPMIRVGPQVRYRSYTVTEQNLAGAEVQQDIGFYTIEIAGRLTFGG